MQTDSPNGQKDNKPDDPGHGRPPVIVYVNTRETAVEEKELTFDQVIRLAFPNGPFTENVVYTVTYDYEHGGGDSMDKNSPPVKVKKGMVFSVGQSDKS